ncbi:MAG: photosystem II biogenesis protein Psp29 [Cyanobacteria bacterium P01_D01_bin.123]
MNTVRTVASTKAAFLANYPRPINSVYRRAVEEILIDLHLVTVNERFAYNPFFALGLTTVYDTFMQGYAPLAEVPTIFIALCKALQLKPDIVRKDADMLVELLRSGDRQQHIGLFQLEDGSSDVGGLKGILTGIRDNKDFYYSRTFAIGLYSAYEMFAPEDEEKAKLEAFKGIATNLNLPTDRVHKDLELYRKMTEKMQMAQEALAEAAAAARSQKERRAAAAANASNSSTETDAPVESESVTSD